MPSRPSIIARLLLILLAPFALSGCATQLVPTYSDSFFQSIVAANQSALVLFAQLEPGSPPADAGKFADQYAQTIATFDGLQMQAATRPFPPLAARIAQMPFLSKVCSPGADPQGCLDASGHALKAAADGFRELRKLHAGPGLTSDTVRVVRSGYDTEINQVLTVEAALKR